MHKGFWGKHEEKRPLGRHRCKWDDDLKMDLYEEERRDMDWIVLVQDRERWQVLVNVVMNFQVP